MRVLKLLFAQVAVFGFAAAVSASCTVSYPATAFQCDPNGLENCPDGYFCCSDDPTAMDVESKETLDSVVLPAYQGRGGEGVPLFSGVNNSLSRSGMCVELSKVPAQSALQDANATGCPVPCNPSWDSASVGEVCGSGYSCCQTVELEVEDCTFDPSAQCWRPARGIDILNSEIQDPWSVSTHATHQDPGPVAENGACRVFARGASQQLGLVEDDVWKACLKKLTVADQRGFCLADPQGLGCPLDAVDVAGNPVHIDVCTQRNINEGYSC